MASELEDAIRRCLASEPLAGKRVIDFGCGSGELGVWMAGEGAEVYLVDLDRGVVDSALERAKAAGVERRVRGIVVHGERLDMFADRGFDLVYARAIPSRDMLAEIARAMKPDAKLVVAAARLVDPAALSDWFGAIRVVWPERQRWLARLAPGKKKPGGAVIAARRAS